MAGAGFAGLMAAYRIVQAGHEVVVLEARGRVGGRVWSQELLPGDPRTVVERGGEFVLDGYDVMRGVLAELGLGLAGTAMSYYQRDYRGGAGGTDHPTDHPTDQATAQDVARCAGAVAAACAAAAPGTSLARVVAGWEASPALAAYLSRVEATNGVSAGVLAASAVGDVTAGFGGRPSWRVAGGNQRVARELAARLGSSVRLNTPAVSIQHDGRGCGSARPGKPRATPRSSRCRWPCCAACPSHRRCPDPCQRAWQRAGLAHNAKLHVPLTAPARPDARAAPSAVQSVPGKFWTWTAADATGQVQPVLHSFGGTEAGPGRPDRRGRRPRPGRPVPPRSVPSWAWTSPAPCSLPGTTIRGPVSRTPR